MQAGYSGWPNLGASQNWSMVRHLPPAWRQASFARAPFADQPMAIPMVIPTRTAKSAF